MFILSLHNTAIIMHYEIISETFEVVKGVRGRFAECLQIWEKEGENSEFGIRNSELWLEATLPSIDCITVCQVETIFYRTKEFRFIEWRNQN